VSPVLRRALQPLPEHEELPQDLAVMGEPANSNAGLAKELHADLVRKYKKHERAIETAWRSFDTAQREACLSAGTPDGAVLQHPTDRALGNVYKFIPECNLRDIAESGPDFLLDLLRHRA